MSYLALYRKYRPQNFSEIVGQENIKKILINSIEKNMISHAYLFFGPRGTGKTTMAKLIAKLVNCPDKKGVLACEKCPSCIAYNNKNHPDIIEMDAASNNGVDEIREIKDKINLVPSLSKYKIYIIDEVHMLSIGAFNALLKTLEEPPEHVIFILATTEFYKVPETIISRCQCYEFNKISEKNIKNKLEEIVDKEKFDVDMDVLDLIAKYSDGGLRDAINLLDELICITNKVTVNDFYDIKGLTKRENIIKIVDFMLKNNVNEIFNIIDELDNKGKNLILLSEEIMIYLKDLLIDNQKNKKNIELDEFIYNSIEIINTTIVNMKNSNFPKTILEVNLLKIMRLSNMKKDIIKDETIVIEEQKENNNEIVKPINLIKNKDIYVENGKIKFEETKIIEQKISELSEIIEQNRKIRINNTFATANKEILENLKINWNKISEYAYMEEYASVSSYLIDGTLKAAGKNYLIISVAYSSVFKNALINIKKIEKLLNIVMNEDYKIAFILESEWDELKRKYINDKNAGIIYSLQEEKDEPKCKQEKNIVNNKSEIIKIAENLFSDDIIEIK